jgi:class 3 adenylate cyclase
MSITDTLGAGEARLWRLVAKRCEDDADTELIDKKIWDLFGEQWAVMFTDLSGFSRGVADFGIVHFLQIIYQHNTLVAPIIDDHQGFLLKVEGDSLMALFRRPQAALDCAIEMQNACQRISKRKSSEEEILLCIGLGYGPVLRIGEHEVFGAQVNAASKLGEDTAGPNEILVTAELANVCGGADSKKYTEIDAVIPGAEKVYNVAYDYAG